jgi:hypothetical protein
MGKVKWTAIGLLFLVIVIAGIVFFAYKPQASPDIELRECKTLSYNGENAVNIVFFSSKKQAENYMNGLYGFEPFVSNKNVFNVYYIDDYNSECELYKGIALLCYSKSLLKTAGSCPNDIIVAVKDMAGGIRSSAYMNVISLNSKLPVSVFTHELGHVFANLADEYVPAKLSSGVKNCVKNCDKFEDKNDGCFSGCSEENYFRSVDNGIMKTLGSNKFGAFNELILEEKINEKSRSLTGMAVGSERECAQEQYHMIEGVYQENKMQVLGQKIVSGCVGGNGEGGFDYQVLDDKNNALSSDNFNPELIFTDVNEENGELMGGSASSDKSFIIKVPLIEGAKKLDVRKDGQSIAMLDLDKSDLEARPCRIL